MLSRLLELVILIFLLCCQQVVFSKSNNISNLIKQINTVQNENDKIQLIDELKKNKPTNTTEENIVIDSIGDNDLDIQEAAIQIIINNKLHKAESTLIKRFQKKNKYIEQKELKKFNKDIRIRSYAVIALGEMHSMDALDAFIDEIGDNVNLSNELDVRLLCGIIAKYGKSSLHKVIKKVKKIGNKNPQGRMLLLTAVQIMEDKTASKNLKEIFEENDDADIKSAVASALRNIGEAVDVKKLIKSLMDHEKIYKKGKSWLETKNKLVEAIGDTRNPDAISFLKERIENELKKVGHIRLFMENFSV